MRQQVDVHGFRHSPFERARMWGSDGSTVVYHFTRTPSDPFTELFTLVLPPLAQSLPISPYRLVVCPRASVKPPASSVLLPPVGAEMSVRLAPFRKLATSAPLEQTDHPCSSYSGSRGLQWSQLAASRDSQLEFSSSGFDFKTAIVRFFILSAAAGSAAAQSSVNLFGVADASVRRISSGDGRAYSLSSGGAAASRWGFRAQEDLGGGLAAGAWLESTVNFDDGTGNSARGWNRRSTVSLMGEFGEVRLGHDLTPAYTAFGEFDTFGVSGLADQGKFYSTAFGSGIEGTGLWARADNMVSYFTPNTLGGFYANLAVAAGEGIAAKKYSGGRVGYAADGLNVTAAYSTFAGVAGNLRRSSVAASYEFSVAKLLGSVVRNQYLGASRVVTQVGVVVPFGLSAVRANFTRADASGVLDRASIDKDDATQIALGYTYNLSKRTSLYATAVNIKNKGKAAFSVGVPPAAAPGRSSRGTELGISHRF